MSSTPVLTAPTVSTPSDRPWAPTLLGLGLLVTTADLLILLAVTVIPPVLVIAVLTAIGLALLPFRPGAASAGLVVIGVIGVIGGAPFALEGLGHPESTLDFLHGLLSLPGRAVMVLAAVATLREWGGPARPVLVAAIAVTLGAAVLSVAIPAPQVQAVAAQASDFSLVANASSWDQSSLTAETGDLLAVVNEDPIRHNLTIDGTDVSVEIPASGTVGVDLDLAPGEYRYICNVAGHETMEGTLTVR